MRTKKFIVPALVLPLTIVEAVHFKESEAFAEVAAPSVSSVSHTLAFPPHSHSDLPIEGQATTVTAFT